MANTFLKKVFPLILFSCVLIINSCKKEKLEIVFSSISSGTEKNIYNIFGLSNDTLYACGGEDHHGFILKSNDGGNSWQTISTSFNRPIHSIYFMDSKNGFCGGDSSNVFITDDAGITWYEYTDYVGVPYQYRVPLHKIFFTDSVNAFCIGGKNFGQGIIYHSNNGGTSFHTHGFEHELRSAAKCSKEIFAAGYGTMLTSTDNENWSILNSPNEYFTGILFIDDLRGFACGYNGGIYKTTDGGKAWNAAKKSNNSVSTSREHFLCLDNNKNTIVACGYGGATSYSYDKGENWKTGITFSETKINAVKLLNEKKGVAVGNNGKIFLFEL